MPSIPGAIQKIVGLFFDKGGAVANVKHPDFGCIGDGVVDDTIAFGLALAFGGALLVPAGTYRLTVNTIIPANVSLTMAKGAIINIPVGVTLTVLGQIIAGNREVFDGLGTVDLDNSPSEYNLAWFKTTNGYINERWDFAKRGMATFRTKVIRVPRPYEGQAGVLKSGNRLFWLFSDTIKINDSQNASTWYIEGEFSANNDCSAFLQFEGAAKPENVYFYGPINAIASSTQTVTNGINILAGARIFFFGAVVLNGFKTSVKIGGTDQVAAVGDIYMPRLQASFFTNAAVYIYGKAGFTVQGVKMDWLDATAAQLAGHNAVEIRGLTRAITIDDVYYATDVPKNGYLAVDVDNVVYLESNAEGEILHTKIGAIYQASANNGIKTTSATALPLAIRDLTVGRIFGKFHGSGADLDYCTRVTVTDVENASNVTLGANSSYCDIRNAGGGLFTYTDSGSQNLLNGLGKQTRGAGTPPAPSLAWPIGALIRETSDGRTYIRIAAAAVAADFVEVCDIVIRASAAYDPPSLATGVRATTTVTVTGAVLGDYAEVSFSRDLQGIDILAYVSAADTVTVVFMNNTGGTLDLLSGSIRVKVRKL